MSRPIKYADIKVGDRIRITREIEVSKLFENQDFLRDGQGVDGRTFFAKGADLELVSRPLPDPPVRVGSVVNVFSRGGNTSARWMLHSSGQWNSANGGVKSRSAFRGWLEEVGFEFEVVA